MGFGVGGLGFGVGGWGVAVQDVGCWVLGVGCRVQFGGYQGANDGEDEEGGGPAEERVTKPQTPTLLLQLTQTPNLKPQFPVKLPSLNSNFHQTPIPKPTFPLFSGVKFAVEGAVWGVPRCR